MPLSISDADAWRRLPSIDPVYEASISVDDARVDTPGESLGIKRFLISSGFLVVQPGDKRQSLLRTPIVKAERWYSCHIDLELI